MIRAAIIPIVAVAIVAGGCGDANRDAPPLEQTAEYFGRLPGLTNTPNVQLQNELARIVDEEATPELLTDDEVPAERNVAAELARLFIRSRVAETFDSSTAIFPPGRFVFSPVELQKAINYREKYDGQQRRARKALDRPESSLAIRYVDGFEADLWLVDVIRICARLEAFQAAESLSDDDPAGATEAFGYMLRLASRLALEKHATSRLEAAFVREEALAVLQTIVGHPKAGPKHLEAARALIEEQLQSWPPDAAAWIGDRALGMHAYELVRAGRLVDLLTPEEAGQFTAEEIIKELPEAARRTADADELYYLVAMRRIIEICSRPYYARVELFEELRSDLQEKRNSSEFPLVAGRLLLVDIENGHEIQARDRAGCEAWALALSVAVGREAPPYKICPVTGKEYEVVRQDDLVSVWIEDNRNRGAPPSVSVPVVRTAVANDQAPMKP